MMRDHSIVSYIPASEIIPTKLRLLVDGKLVSYSRLKDTFGYDFEFNNGETEDEAVGMAEYLAWVMCCQSYDHGQEWLVTSVELVDQEKRFKIGEIVRVLFRIRDSY